MDFFDEDPFFGDMHRMMRSQQNLMANMLNDPFGMHSMNNNHINPRQQMIQDGPSNSRGNIGMGGGSMLPFGGLMGGGLLGGGMFGGMNRMMTQMESLQQQALQDPGAQVYSHSTVLSMDRGAGGAPRVVERTNSVHKHGKVKEVRKTIRDTGTGEDAITIGHHIGDRGHVITKKRDKGGKLHEDQQFIGISQDQARRFDNEFGERVRHEPSSFFHKPRVHAIERGSRRRAASSDQAIEHTGPIIEEITDEEASASQSGSSNADHVGQSPKRHKTHFGGIFSKK